jgi:hypothetical protein
MAEQQQAQEAARRGQEATRRAGERRREGGEELGRVTGQLASLGAETLGTWAELNHRVSQDLMRVSSGAMEETVRAASEIQQAAFAAWRDAQAAAFRWQTLWPEAFRDPLRWYHRAFEHAVGTMQDAIDLGRRNTETAMRSFDRLQSQSEEAVRTLDDTFRQGATKIRDIQSRTETTRVA